MSNVSNWIAFSAFVSYCAMWLRLLVYCRGQSTFKRHFSIFAWLLMVSCGARALEMLTKQEEVSLGQAGIAFTLCVLVYHAKGNVANLFRGKP